MLAQFLLISNEFCELHENFNNLLLRGIRKMKAYFFLSRFLGVAAPTLFLCAVNKKKAREKFIISQQTQKHKQLARMPCRSQTNFLHFALPLSLSLS
jgi:hypothetical protein